MGRKGFKKIEDRASARVLAVKAAMMANQNLPLAYHKLIATGARVTSLDKGAKLWCKGTLARVAQNPIFCNE